MTAAHALPGAAQRVNWYRVGILSLLSLTGVGLLVGLGIWQLERRVWKLELIRKVETRFYAPVQPFTPAIARDPAAHEYSRVAVIGAFIPHLDTWVHASTERGGGYWILSPLRQTDGQVILVNRGFVPMDTPRQLVVVAAARTVIGVMRLSEPNGSWPRRNRPDQDRWYSRDVAAIARARGLTAETNFFLDATADSPAAQPVPPADPAPTDTGASAALPGSPRVFPEGGLTVVHFRNAHLSYAFTWFGLALMTAAAGAYLLHGECVGRRPSG